MWDETNMPHEEEVYRLREEVERLRKALSGEVMLKSLELRDGHLDLAVTHPAVMAIASELASFFKAAGGQNYVEVRMHHPDTGDLVLSVQRVLGKTPHELRKEAEVERDEARLRTALLYGLLRDVDTYFVRKMPMDALIERIREAL